MSPRAACRLESLGFGQVFDYVPGKADWMAAGLAMEGTLAEVLQAGDVMRTDPPTCRPTDPVGDASAKAAAGAWPGTVVADDDGCVLGSLSGDALDADPSLPVEAVMRPGPATVRPNERLEPLVGRMQDRHVEQVVVTTQDGKLVGVVLREDAERLLAEGEEAVWEDCDGCPGTWRTRAA